MRRAGNAAWEIVSSECRAGIFVIRDVGHSVGSSVTNEAERVVQKLVDLGDVVPGRDRLFYYDSDGSLDEILVDERGAFAGFRRGGPPAEDETGRNVSAIGISRPFSVEHDPLATTTIDLRDGLSPVNLAGVDLRDAARAVVAAFGISNASLEGASFAIRNVSGMEVRISGAQIESLGRLAIVLEDRSRDRRLAFGCLFERMANVLGVDHSGDPLVIYDAIVAKSHELAGREAALAEEKARSRAEFVALAEKKKKGGAS